jgi:hypothetical protein
VQGGKRYYYLGFFPFIILKGYYTREASEAYEILYAFPTSNEISINTDINQFGSRK